MKKTPLIKETLNQTSPFYLKTKIKNHPTLSDYVSINFEVLLKKDEVLVDEFMLINKKMFDLSVSELYLKAFKELWIPLKELIVKDILPQLKRIQSLEKTHRKQSKKIMLLSEQLQTLDYTLKNIMNHPLIDENSFRIKS